MFWNPPALGPYLEDVKRRKRDPPAYSGNLEYPGYGWSRVSWILADSYLKNSEI